MRKSAPKRLGEAQWVRKVMILMWTISKKKDKQLAADIIAHFVKAIEEKIVAARPRIKRKKYFVFARKCTSIQSNEILTKVNDLGLQLLPHLAPSEYNLFLNLKQWLIRKNLAHARRLSVPRRSILQNFAKITFSQQIIIFSDYSYLKN